MMPARDLAVLFAALLITLIIWPCIHRSMIWGYHFGQRLGERWWGDK